MQVYKQTIIELEPMSFMRNFLSSLKNRNSNTSIKII